MPNEQIGTCGHAQWPDREAIHFELEFGIACLRRHCGPEPPGSVLDVVWHEHDLGAYATISLVWEGPGVLFDEDWAYPRPMQYNPGPARRVCGLGDASHAPRDTSERKQTPPRTLANGPYRRGGVFGLRRCGS